MGRNDPLDHFLATWLRQHQDLDAPSGPDRLGAIAPQLVTNRVFRDRAFKTAFIQVVAGRPRLAHLEHLALVKSYWDARLRDGVRPARRENDPEPPHTAKPHPGGDYVRDPTYHLAAKTFPASVAEIAREIDVGLIRLPANLLLQIEPQRGEKAIGLTTPKAWRIVYTLLQGKHGSAREVSRAADVSYAWTHRVLQFLVRQGYASEHGGRPGLSDLEALTDLVLLERPLRNLSVDVLRTDFDDPLAAAKELMTLEPQPRGLVFTGPAVDAWRNRETYVRNVLHVYTDDPQLLRAAVNPGDGLELHVLRPDRALGSEIHDGIPVVRPDQLVLDLAGMAVPMQPIGETR